MATRIKGRVGRPVHLDIVPPDAEVTVTEKTMSVKKEKVTIVGDETTRETEISPQFVKQLFPVVDAEIGSNVKLECQVDGMPEPQISWLFNGQPISQSKRRTMTFTNQVSTLTVIGVGRMDSGEYICRALNALGDASTKCTVRVGDKPANGVPQQVMQPGFPPPQMDGTPIVPQVTPSAQSRPGAPAPEVTPAPLTEPCAVIPMQPSQIPHVPLGAEMSAVLQVDMGNAGVATRFQQSSTYQQSSAVAYSGVQQQTYQQQVQTGLTTSSSTYVRRETHSGRTTPVHLRRETHSGRSTPIRISSRQTTPVRSGRSTPVRSGRSTPTFQEAPRFTMPLRDLTINDGDRAVFKVMWRGIPRPTLNWYFNSEPIIPSDDFQIKIDINRGESVLIIKEVFPDDEGEYMCKAESPLGAAVTHCHLFVRLPSSSEEDIEKLVSHSEDVVRLQESLHLKERSSFSETISIDTQKRFKEFQMQFQIPDRKAERSEVLMRQQAALRGMRMHVDVELPTPRTLVETKTINLQKSIDVKSSMQKQDVKSFHKQLAYLRLPLEQQRRFSETIAIDHSKPRTDPVQLTFSLPEQRRRLEKSAIQVRQRAALRGMKMEVEIAENRRQTAKYEYRTKKHAQAIGTQRQEFHMQLDGAPPHFTIDLTSAKVMDGEEVKFKATVVGNPMPEITWYKNGKVIVENPDFHTTYDKKTGICTLHILEVFPQDTGEYRCIAVNQYGRAVTGATLQVDVFEYVPDSEEASASAAESLPDRQVSEDEAEFLERTQAFIANMQKLRQELQEEQVREEEVPMTEEYHEETVQIADVKWQIPRKAVTMEIQMAEQTTVDVPVEKTEMTEEQRIEISLAQPQVEVKPQMQVQSSVKIIQSEKVEDQPSPPSPEMPVEEEIMPDLKQPVKQPIKEVHVQPQVEHTAEELTSEFVTEVTTEMTDGKPVEVELAEHIIQQRKESLAMPMEEHLMPEIVQESLERVPSPEETHETRVQVEMVQNIQKVRKESLAMQMEEHLLPEIVQESVERVPSPEESQKTEVLVDLAQHAIQQAEQSMVEALEEVTIPEIVQEDVERVPSPEESKEQHVTVELSQHIMQEAKESLVMPQEELLQPEDVEESAARVPSPEASEEQHVQVELAQHVVEQAMESLVQPQEELLHPEIVEESAERIPTPEGAGEECVQVQLSVTTTEDAKQSLVQPTEEIEPTEMVEESKEYVPEPEGAGEEQVQVQLAIQITEQAIGTMVAPQEEVLQPELVEETADRIPTPEGAGQEEVQVELAMQITEQAIGTMVAPQEEVLQPELIEETADRVPTPEGAGQEEVQVELAMQITEQARASLVAPLEEMLQPEMVEESADRVPTPEGAGEQQVQVELSVQTTEEAKASLVTPLEEVLQPEVVEESQERVPTPEGAGEQHVQVELSVQTTEEAKASLVTPLEEMLQPEVVEESQERVPTPEGAAEDQVFVDIDRAWTMDAAGSMVMPQAELVTAEETLESGDRVPTPEGAGEEQVMVDLGKGVMEAARGSMVMPLEVVLPPEVVEESQERVPTPEGAGEEQVKVSLSQSVIEQPKGSMVMTQEERLKEEDIMDLLDRMPSPVATEEQEVVVHLDQPGVESAKEHYTGFVEERHSEEEEEDIFFEAPEPELEGEEVQVDLGLVLIQEREKMLSETQLAQIEIIETGEAHAEYDEEDTRKEQVTVLLEQAKKKKVPTATLR